MCVCVRCEFGDLVSIVGRIETQVQNFSCLFTIAQTLKGCAPFTNQNG